MADHVGQQLGNYRLLRMLGQGAFATVYLGEHLYLERPAAIKVLHVQIAPAKHESFRREARTIAQLDHPHIIRVHDFGIADQMPYLVMEYTPGGTLRSCHPKGSQLSFKQIVTYVKQIASALDYAHQQQVIHRDIKPENILLNAKHEVVLSDFGLAVVQHTLDSFSTPNPAGTPLYMAPEQIQRKPCAASDQYALGVMVYEWLCGEPPFLGSLYEVLGQHLHNPPPSLRARVKELPLAVEDAVMRALAKDPQRRFVHVVDFASALEEALLAIQPLSQSRSVEEQTALPAARSASMPTTSIQKPSDDATPWAQRSERERELVPSVPPQSTMYGQSNSKQAMLAQMNRERLLRRVRSFWITGVFQHSLHGAALMTLGLEAQPDAVANPWHLVMQHPDTTPHPLPAGTRITQVYDAADGELLILGAPGSGKTTLLLELARNLLNRAERDEQHPTPVVFNLSSWAMKQQPLVEWLVEELNTKYQIPSKLAQALVEADQILPLLDGLDEVVAEERTACINTINTYWRAHSMLPLVVCSRSADYLDQTARVNLRSAVLVQPLAQEQIEAYLRSAGPQVEALRVALHRDPDLQTLATTPLMLIILTLAYQGIPLQKIAPLGTLPAKQRQVFTTYVQRMLTRRGPLKAGTPHQVIQWLTFLATRMRAHNQTVFYLEQIQPDWLAPEEERMYKRLGIQLPSILIGMLAGLILSTFQGSIAPLTSLIIFGALGGFLGGLYSEDTPRRASPSELQDGHPQQERHRRVVGQVVVSALIGLLVALCFGWSLGEQFGFGERLREGSIFGVAIGLGCLFLQLLFSSVTPRIVSSNTVNTRRWKHLVQTVHGQRTLRTVAVMGLAGGLGSWLINSGQLLGLINGMFYYALSLGLISTLVSMILDMQAEGVYLTERLRWTRDSLMRSLLTPKHMRRSLLIATVIGVITGLTFGLVVGSTIGLSNGLSTGLSTGLFYWILLGLFQGISSERIEEQLRQVPNQGIQRSLRNCVLMGVISGGVIWLISILSDGLGFGLYYVLIRVQGSKPPEGIMGLGSWLARGLDAGFNVGLFLGLCGGLLACTTSGGLAAWRHGILRWLLQHAGAIPRHYVRFLDEAASHILLQRVGGGYIFVHRLLLEYFAAVETESVSDTAAKNRKNVSPPRAPVPAEDPRLHPCGHEWRPNARFCAVCGKPLSS